MTRILFTITLYIITFAAAQAKDSYDMSTTLSLDEVGINKVLCMENGNTMLFHFQIGKPIKVMVFDSTHKRIASTQAQCRELDLFMLTTSLFKGLYEIGGEAVVFFEQQNLGKHSLIRMRFNGNIGKLVEERIVGRSKSLAKPTRFYVMKQRSEAGYKILYSQDVMQFRECNVHVAYYNARHEQYRDVPLHFDRKSYDYMTVVGAESHGDGVCVTLALSNMVMNGTRSNSMAITNPIYNHYLQVFYIHADSTRPIQRNIDLASNIIPYYTHYSHNRFAGTINLMLLSYSDALYRFGLEMRPTAMLADLFLTFDPENLDGRYTWVTNKLANEMLMEKTDTAQHFRGFPIRMYTNNNGLSTIISESYDRNFTSESFSRNRVMETYLGNICITQVNDEGKEIWGTVLPKAQYFKSYRHYYDPASLAKRWQQHAMFDDMPRQVYERQFMSGNTYNNGSDIYIIFNDGSKNFSKQIDEQLDTVFLSALSNACYYKLDKKRNLTKKFLFGEPMKKEYKSSFIEGADYDEKRNTYVSVIRYKRSDYVSLRLAWATLD
ncbi:hypothetical protein GCM10023093_08880 [Nemorincola caseinilytica]|uniref:Uncharacterized protein n=1 Tax=Nemorincola caseinilytica TaxID=2054315 RepID=A0ABP8N6Y6_9BACT